MKDKEKQVEEIIKVLLDCGRQFENIDTATADHNYVSYFYPIFKTYAEALIKNNIVQIHEDSVVLTKAEKQKLLHEMYEQGRFDALADLDKEGKVVLPKDEYRYLKDMADRYDPFWFCAFGGCEGVCKECKDTCEMSIFVKEHQKTTKDILNELEGFFWETAINDTKYFDLYQNLYRSIKEFLGNKYGVTKEG